MRPVIAVRRKWTEMVNERTAAQTRWGLGDPGDGAEKAKWIQCHACNGTGIADQAQCAKCAGLGRIKTSDG